MKKTNLLLFIFIMISSIINAQTKTFSTKQEAENFIVESIKKASAAYYKFDSYDKGEILFKNDEIEDMDEDDLKEDDGKDIAYATPNAKMYKCNKYVKVHLNKIVKIKIDTLTSNDGETYFKYWAIGNQIIEKGYMPKKSKTGYLKKSKNEFVFLDTIIESQFYKREDLLMSDDKVLQAEFLEAFKVFVGLKE